MSRIVAILIPFVLVACGDDSSSSGDAGNLIIHKKDASDQTFEDAASVSDAASSSMKLLCPKDQTCEEEYGDSFHFNGNIKKPLVCAFGTCGLEPAECTADSCGHSVCVKNLKTYCPECSAETGCGLRTLCGGVIDEDDCLSTSDGDAGGDAGSD